MFVFSLLITDVVIANGIIESSDSIRHSSSLSFDLEAGGSYYSTEPNVPLHIETHLTKVQTIFSGRINWHTDHRLTLSLETGYFKMYSFTLRGPHDDGSIGIISVPLLLEFSMPVTKQFHVRAGAGSFFETTELNYLGKVKSHVVNLGWTAGGSYDFYSNKKSKLGIDVKWLNAAEAQHAVMAIQLFYRRSFLQW